MSDERAGSDSNESTDDDDRDLTHLNEEGNVQMIDVGAKPDSRRRAVARGTIHLNATTVRAIHDDEIGKGDVLATARIGAIQAVKHTWEAIPMCHQIPVTNIDTKFEVTDESVALSVTVGTTGRTGCGMEALEGVTTGLNVVWDVVEAAEKSDDSQYPGTHISDVEVVTKEKETLD